MTDLEDAELIRGFFAYDTGCVDSGIHDEIAKSELFDRLHAIDGVAPAVSEYAADLLSADGRAAGYTLEDVREFIDWLQDNGYEV